MSQPTHTNKIIRLMNWLASFAAFAALTGGGVAYGQSQTWVTVDDFQYVPGKASGAGAMTADISGNIYVSGYGNDAAGVEHGLVMASPDAGSTWSTIEDFPNGSFSCDIG